MRLKMNEYNIKIIMKEKKKKRKRQDYMIIIKNKIMIFEIIEKRKKNRNI